MKLTQKSLNEMVRTMIANTGAVPQVGIEQKMPRLMEFIRKRGTPLTAPREQVPLPKETITPTPAITPVAEKREHKKYPFLTE